MVGMAPANMRDVKATWLGRIAHRITAPKT